MRGTPCPNGCYAKYRQDNAFKESRKEANRKYDKEQRKNVEFYHSTEWQRVRDLCKNRYNYLCVYSFIKYKKIVSCHLVHHITEINDDMSKALEMDNLIPVCHSAHNEIHVNYKIDKKKAQEELREMIKKWNELYCKG